MSIARKIAFSKHAREHKSPATKQRTSAANINRHLRADVDMKQSVLIVAATMLCNATMASADEQLRPLYISFNDEIYVSAPFLAGVATGVAISVCIAALRWADRICPRPEEKTGALPATPTLPAKPMTSVGYGAMDDRAFLTGTDGTSLTSASTSTAAGRRR